MPFGYRSVIVFDWTALPRLFIFNLGGVPASGEQSVEFPARNGEHAVKSDSEAAKHRLGFIRKTIPRGLE